MSEVLTLLITGIICSAYGANEMYKAYQDVYSERLEVVVGVVEDESTVGNHGNYTVVRVNGENFYNPSSKFEFEVGTVYEIAYYEKTKFIQSIRRIE